MLSMMAAMSSGEDRFYGGKAAFYLVGGSIYIIDVDDITKPKIISRIDILASSNQNVSITQDVERKILFVIESFYSPSRHCKITIYNIRNRYAPWVMGEVTISGHAPGRISHYIKSKDKLVFGLGSDYVVVDVSDLRNPTAVVYNLSTAFPLTRTYNGFCGFNEINNTAIYQSYAANFNSYIQGVAVDPESFEPLSVTGSTTSHASGDNIPDILVSQHEDNYITTSKVNNNSDGLARFDKNLNRVIVRWGAGSLISILNIDVNGLYDMNLFTYQSNMVYRRERSLETLTTSPINMLRPFFYLSSDESMAFYRTNLNSIWVSTIVQLNRSNIPANIYAVLDPDGLKLNNQEAGLILADLT